MVLAGRRLTHDLAGHELAETLVGSQVGKVLGGQSGGLGELGHEQLLGRIGTTEHNIVSFVGIRAIPESENLARAARLGGVHDREGLSMTCRAPFMTEDGW